MKIVKGGIVTHPAEIQVLRSLLKTCQQRPCGSDKVDGDIGKVDGDVGEVDGDEAVNQHGNDNDGGDRIDNEDGEDNVDGNSACKSHHTHVRVEFVLIIY